MLIRFEIAGRLQVLKELCGSVSRLFVKVWVRTNLIKSVIMNDCDDMITKLGNTFKTHILAAFPGAP